MTTSAPGTRTTTRWATTILAAMSLLGLAGCVTLPPVPATPTVIPTVAPPAPEVSDAPSATESAAPTAPAATPQEGFLVGTTWSGDDSHGNAMTFTLAADGTVDNFMWNDTGPWFEDSDTWTVLDDNTFVLYVSNIQEIGGITYSGSAVPAMINMSGVADVGGETFVLVLLQQ